MRGNDSDLDGDTLTVTAVGTPAHGTAVIEDGNVRYTPSPNYNGGDSFTYTISDGNGGTDSASVALTVTPVNDAPVATDSSAQVAQDTPEDIPLHATDLDGDPLTYAIVAQPEHGTLSGAGSSRTYTPDDHYHGTDSFTFTANDGAVDSNVATVSITVTERDPAMVNVNDASSEEGDAGELDAVFTVSISEPQTDLVVIDAASTDGTAHEPGDYGAMQTRLTFAPGQTSKTVVVKVHGDTVDEPDENFVVNLTVVSGDVVLGDGQGEGTIMDDDPLSSLAVGDAGVTEGSSGATMATLTVTLSSASEQTVTVDYQTADGTAHAPSDYTGTSGTLTFAAGQTTKNVTVSVNGDTEIEPNETFLVELTNPTNATIERGVGTGTILDDDSAGPPPPPPPPRRHLRLRLHHPGHLHRFRHRPRRLHHRLLRRHRGSRGRSTATGARSWARRSATSCEERTGATCSAVRAETTLSAASAGMTCSSEAAAATGSSAAPARTSSSASAAPTSCSAARAQIECAAAPEPIA